MGGREGRGGRGRGEGGGVKGGMRGYMGNGGEWVGGIWALYGRPTLLLNKGWPALPKLALIKGPEEAGSHALDGLACFTRLRGCARRDCRRGWLAPTAWPLQ